MEVIYNQTTGRVSWVSDAVSIDGYYDGAAANFNIIEVDVAVIGGASAIGWNGKGHNTCNSNDSDDGCDCANTV